MKNPKPPKKKTSTLMEFAKATKSNPRGPRSPLDDHPTAAADLEAFAKMKVAGTATASWTQFATWFRENHGIDMRGNSLCTWARNRGFLDGK